MVKKFGSVDSKDNKGFIEHQHKKMEPGIHLNPRFGFHAWILNLLGKGGSLGIL